MSVEALAPSIAFTWELHRLLSLGKSRRTQIAIAQWPILPIHSSPKREANDGISTEVLSEEGIDGRHRRTVKDGQHQRDQYKQDDPGHDDEH